MNKLKKNGFTLVELLAVIVILGMVMIIVVPNVNKLINLNKERNQEQLVKSVKNAAKLYISDYKYSISIDGECGNDKTKEINLLKNFGGSPSVTFTDSKIPVRVLVNDGDLTTNKDGNIYSPSDKEKKLKLDTSYIVVKYSCKTKDYIYNEPVLDWE